MGKWSEALRVEVIGCDLRWRKLGLMRYRPFLRGRVGSSGEGEEECLHGDRHQTRVDIEADSAGPPPSRVGHVVSSEIVASSDPAETLQGGKMA